jgi:hypothetical protein
MAVVVSDTSPLRALEHLQRLDILQSLFGKVLVPPAVVEELRSPAGAFRPIDVRSLAGCIIQAPSDRNRVDQFIQYALHEGESEALALALEVNADAVLMDDAAGRAAAMTLGLTPIGVIGVLIRAKDNKLIAEVKPLLDRLMSELNFYVSATLRAESLRIAGEAP